MPQPVKVIKQISSKRLESVQDFVNALNLKYSSLQKIIIEKLDIKDVFSINNIGNDRCAIIGLVRKIKEVEGRYSIEMEDATGSVSVLANKTDASSKLNEDDVIASTGYMRGGTFEADALIWPDVPTMTPTKGNGKMIFLSNLKLTDKTIELVKAADYVFIYNCTGWLDVAANTSAQWVVVGGSGNITVVTDPSIVEAGGLKILIHFGKDLAADVLRRRFLTSNGNDFIVEPAPDIVFTSTAEHLDYRGVTIIGNGTIDAATREALAL